MTKSALRLTFIFLFILCFYFTQINIKYPHIGLEVVQNKNNQFEISTVHLKGAAEHEGMKKGDIILSIDGASPEEHMSIKKYKLIEQANYIVGKRNGKILIYNLQTKMYKDQFLLHIVLPFIVLILSFLFSIFLFKYKRNEKISFILIILFQLYGVSLFTGAASARTEPLAQFVSISTLLLIPLLLLHFFYTYFQKYAIQLVRAKILKILYISTFSLITFTTVHLALSLSPNFYIITKSLVLLMFVLNVISCVYFFGRGFLKYRKSIYSSLFKIINVGIFVSFIPFILLYALPTIILKHELISGEVAFLFTFFLPLTFVYLVSANRLLDIDFYIKRITYYVLISIIPAILLTKIVTNFIYDFSLINWIQIFIVNYLFFIIIFFVKEELDYRFRSKLFSEKYNLQSSIHQFVQFLSSEKNKNIIQEKFRREIKSVLGISKVALLEYDKEFKSLEFNTGDTLDYPSDQLMDQLNQYIDGKSYIGELHAIDFFYYLIIAENTKKALVLILGEKENLTSINLEEKEWLKSISYFMNVSYQNLQLIEDLIEELENIREQENAPNWVLKMLFHLEEKERKRLSIDLHDSSLQDQLLLYRKLTSILEKYDFESTVKQELSLINEGLLDVIHEIRETCNELMPPFLKEIGIVGSLENLFKKAQLRTNLVVDFVVDTTINNVHLNDDTTLTIYRVVQELINNAEKHSNASKIHICLTCKTAHVLLKYMDNGDGLDEDKITTFKGRIGIYGIKERVRSVDGNIEFSTSIENGLEVLIEIPLQIEFVPVQ